MRTRTRRWIPTAQQTDVSHIIQGLQIVLYLNLPACLRISSTDFLSVIYRPSSHVTLRCPMPVQYPQKQFSNSDVLDKYLELPYFVRVALVGDSYSPVR